MYKKILFCCFGMALLFQFTSALADDPCANIKNGANNKCAYLYNNLTTNDGITSPSGVKQTEDDFNAGHTIAVPPQNIPMPALPKTAQTQETQPSWAVPDTTQNANPPQAAAEPRESAKTATNTTAPTTNSTITQSPSINSSNDTKPKHKNIYN